MDLSGQSIDRRGPADQTGPETLPQHGPLPARDGFTAPEETAASERHSVQVAANRTYVMSEQSPKDQKHETARQLTEDALGAYAEGDQKKGDKMVEEAKRTDTSAVKEVIEDLDEDAGSDHSVPKENR
jgi:hypothetical protein